MCKYCKKLKEIKDLAEKDNVRHIEKWKRYCAKQDELLRWSLVVLEWCNTTFPGSDLIDIKRKRHCALFDLIDRIEKSLSKTWIGK